MTLAPNPSVAVYVIASTFGPEELDETGAPFRPSTGLAPGYRLDVQRECLDAHPGLVAFVVEPASPLHDCGPNGVRLYADTIEALHAAAPLSGSVWDVFTEVGDEGAP